MHSNHLRAQWPRASGIALALRRSFGLSPLLFASALPLVVQAEDDTSEQPTHLESIVVTGSPLGRTADELVQPVDVLAGNELERKRRGTIGETLEKQPGVSTTDFGAGSGRPVIRGQAGPRVEVLENGLSSMDVSDLSPDHAVTIEPAQARQIEIFKGPATLLYGNSASGGVVNVNNSRLPVERVDGLHGAVSSYYGSNADEGSFSGEADYGSGGHVLHADLGWREAGDYEIPGAAGVDGSGSRGTLANSHRRAESGAASYSYITGDGGTYGLSVARFETNYGLPVEEEAFIEMRQTRVDGQALVMAPASFLESIKFRGGTSDYEHTEFEAPGEPGTVFENKQYQGRIEAVHSPWAGLRGSVGVQGNWRDFSALGEEAYVPPVETQQLGVFVVEERPYSLGKFEIGVRIEQNDNKPQENVDRDFTPFSYSLGSLFNVGSDSHLKAYFTHAERSPVPEELYAFGPHAATATFERGNIDARIEKGNNFEIGFDHHQDRWEISASVYYNKLSDYLYLSEVDEGLNADGSGTPASDGEADTVNNEGTFDPEGELLLADYRQADAAFYGYEVELAYAMVQDGPFTLTSRVFADQVHAELDDGQKLPRITPMRYGIGLEASYRRLDGGISFTRVDQQDGVAALETPTDGYNLLDADLSYRVYTAADGINGVSLYLRGSNLLDEEIRRATSFIKDFAPAPGQSVYIGVRMSI